MKLVQNLRRFHLLKQAGLILPAMVLPLGLAGVTIRPSLQLNEARVEMARLEGLLTHIAQRRVALNEFGSLEQLEQFDGLRQKLKSTVPNSLEPIEIYSHIRHSASVAGVDLSGVRQQDPVDTGHSLNGETVASIPVTVNGEGELRSLLHFVTGLEARGFPLTVTHLTFSRERWDDSQFSFTVILGFFHYADEESFASDSDEVEIPQGL